MPKRNPYRQWPRRLGNTSGKRMSIYSGCYNLGQVERVGNQTTMQFAARVSSLGNARVHAWVRDQFRHQRGRTIGVKNRWMNPTPL